MKEQKRVITPKEVAEMYGIAIGTLANLRSKKMGVQYYKRGRKIFYRVDDFEAWLLQSPVLTADSRR